MGPLNSDALQQASRHLGTASASSSDTESDLRDSVPAKPDAVPIKIGFVLDNGRLSCSKPSCTRTFARVSDLKRHMKTIHGHSPQFWCRHADCRRSSSYQKASSRPFTRRDKRDEHERKIHGEHKHACKTCQCETS